jgi:DNA (cytosine-5)-methyltransferase 1
MESLSGCGASIVDRHCTDCGHPALADTYCCQGAASAGYRRTGFCATGIDIEPQPRYPWRFVQADAVEFLREHGHEYAAIHASPPCQLYSACQRIRGREHPDLIGPTRAALAATGRPWVIENVEDARRELRNPVLLCGSMFPGLRTYRHRLFESNVALLTSPHAPHGELTVKMGRALVEGDWYHAVGNFSGVEYVRNNLGVPWMNRDGIRECIPPVYAELVGGFLLAAVTVEGQVAA